MHKKTRQQTDTEINQWLVCKYKYTAYGVYIVACPFAFASWSNQSIYLCKSSAEPIWVGVSCSKWGKGINASSWLLICPDFICAGMLFLTNSFAFHVSVGFKLVRGTQHRWRCFQEIQGPSTSDSGSCHSGSFLFLVNFFLGSSTLWKLCSFVYLSMHVLWINGNKTGKRWYHYLLSSGRKLWGKRFCFPSPELFFSVLCFSGDWFEVIKWMYFHVEGCYGSVDWN